MTRPLALGGAVVYAAAIAAFVYGVAEQQRTYGDDALNWLVLAGLGVLHLAAGLAIGRWWALLLVPLAVVIALPAGYPDDLRGEPLPIWWTFAIGAPIEATLIALGVGLRKLGPPRRGHSSAAGAH